MPRSDLLSIADEVVKQLRVDPRGQYQITEVLLTEAFDRHLVRLLKLPGYRSWRAARLAALEAAEAEPDAEPDPESDVPAASAVPASVAPSRAVASRRPFTAAYALPIARVG